MIKNPHSPVSTIATSTGNKTYKAHLTALKSAYFGLSDDYKSRAAITIGNAIHRIQNKYAGSFGSFSATAATSCGMGNIRLQAENSATEPVYMTVTLTNGTSAVADKSSESYDGTVTLIVM